VLSAGQQISAVGNRPRYTPNWTGSISTTFQLGELAGMENDIWLRVDSIYQGNFFVDNFEYNKVAGYWKFNARLHADINDNFAVELYGSNLTNDLSHNTAVGTTSIFFGTDRKNFATLPRKREFGLKFLTNF
jgi:outer membrane receptor protein involved in Fe transport